MFDFDYSPGSYIIEDDYRRNCYLEGYSAAINGKEPDTSPYILVGKSRPSSRDGQRALYWNLGFIDGKRRRSPETDAEVQAMAWKPYTGPKGGKGWINTNDPDDIRYQVEKPVDITAPKPKTQPKQGWLDPFAFNKSKPSESYDDEPEDDHPLYKNLPEDLKYLAKEHKAKKRQPWEYSGLWSSKPKEPPKQPDPVQATEKMRNLVQNSPNLKFDNRPIIGLILNGIPLAKYTPKDSDWKDKDRLADIDEPEFEAKVIKTKGVRKNPFTGEETEYTYERKLNRSTGCVIIEPDGRVWTFAPSGGFGGVKNSFPKGRIDEGYEPQENAMKEVWEETGLKVKIVDFIGDYERSTSVSRYYLAERIGGTPWDFGWETEAVSLATPKNTEAKLNVPIDKQILADALKKHKARQPKE